MVGKLQPSQRDLGFLTGASDRAGDSSPGTGHRISMNLDIYTPDTFANWDYAAAPPLSPVVGLIGTASCRASRPGHEVDSRALQ
jgi:hypothetical protein